MRCALRELCEIALIAKPVAELTPMMTNLWSIIAHLNRFKDDDSALFADDNRSVPKLTAVLDYHEHCDGTMNGYGTMNGNARFGVHRSSYAFPLSDEWKAWAAMDGKPMLMADFAA